MIRADFLKGLGIGVIVLDMTGLGNTAWSDHFTVGDS